MMTDEALIELAEKIAAEAHSGQFRRDGVTPYLEHPRAVAAICQEHHYGSATIAAAWLHDVLEDSSFTAQSLRDYGIPEDVITAVSLLTKTGDDYEDYIRRVASNDIARQVKLADIKHNSSDSPTAKQVVKYARAAELLGEQ